MCACICYSPRSFRLICNSITCCISEKTGFDGSVKDFGLRKTEASRVAINTRELASVYYLHLTVHL